jgi:hypothetical protein
LILEGPEGFISAIDLLFLYLAQKLGISRGEITPELTLHYFLLEAWDD